MNEMNRNAERKSHSAMQDFLYPMTCKLLCASAIYAQRGASIFVVDLKALTLSADNRGHRSCQVDFSYPGPLKILNPGNVTARLERALCFFNCCLELSGRLPRHSGEVLTAQNL